MEKETRGAYMIGFDFEYYRPQTLDEALNIYFELYNSGKKPMYYGGGTEIISMARDQSIYFDAVIDLKYIYECSYHGLTENDYVIGSGVTLTQIAEANKFPLLAKTIKRIADHTIQDKITLGGNLAGTIIYREAALPLMLADCDIVLMGKGGLMKIPFMQIFNGCLSLKPEEFIVRITINKSCLELPYVHVKKTKNEKIDYPLLTLAAIKIEKTIKAAASGIFSKPMMIPDEYINDKNINTDEKINKTTELIYNYIQEDLAGSKEYKVFVFKNVLKQAIEDLRRA